MYRSFFVLIFFLTLYHFQSCAEEKKHVEKGLIFIKPDNKLILYSGRFDFTTNSNARYSWPGSTIAAKFEGTTCNVFLKDQPGDKHNYFLVIIDSTSQFIIKASDTDTIHKIDTLKDGVHTIRIFKRTESSFGVVEFIGLEIQKGKKLLPLERPVRKIEFIGNSITCGYGNEGTNQNCPFTPETENNYMAYGAITARSLNADYMAIAFSGIGMYRNYGGDTINTMPNRYNYIIPMEGQKWNFSKWQPDVVVINLGTNDFSQTNPDSAVWVNTYLKFLKRVRKNYPNATIFCITGSMMSDAWPPGNKSLTTLKKYLTVIRSEFVKQSDDKIFLFDMSSQGKKGYGCDWHPNVEQHKINAKELTAFIKEKMNW